MGWPRRVAAGLAAVIVRRRAEAEAAGAAPQPEGEVVLQRTVPSTRRRELLVAVLLFGAALAFVAFAAAYGLSASTQALGAALGAGLALVAAACVVAAKLVVVQETIAEPRPPIRHPGAAERVEGGLAQIGEGIDRRTLLGLAATTAVAGLGAAAVAPVLSAAEGVGGGTGSSPWRAGTPLVDEHGTAIRPADVEVGSFVTAFPKGSDPRELGSPVVVVAVDPTQLRPPRGRQGWDVDGILAFSKICTHAGCAVAMLRYPLYEQNEPGPALVCPCHYSTFDVLRGAAVEFGPAGRPLPQLPLRLAADGTLEAAGDMSGPVGPAWWGVSRA
jgi:ubiquinol-cytochrome c reductase iron-sulfur subunit